MKILQNWNFLHELVILGMENNQFMAFLPILIFYNAKFGLVLTLQLTSALQLEGLATKKPRTNKNGVKAPVVS